MSPPPPASARGRETKIPHPAGPLGGMWHQRHWESTPHNTGATKTQGKAGFLISPVTCGKATAPQAAGQCEQERSRHGSHVGAS